MLFYFTRLEPLVKEVEINPKTLATSLVDAVKSPELAESNQGLYFVSSFDVLSL